MGKETFEKSDRAAFLWLPWSLLLLLFWWLLVEGKVDSLYFAIPVIFMAYMARRSLPIPLSLCRINFIEAVAFVPHFIRYSIAAGIDVGWRALTPSMPIRPRLITYPLRLGSKGSRVFLSHVISLMPGTLTCEIGDEDLIVHALVGAEEKIIADTASLEIRVGAIFGEKIEDD